MLDFCLTDAVPEVDRPPKTAKRKKRERKAIFQRIFRTIKENGEQGAAPARVKTDTKPGLFFCMF